MKNITKLTLTLEWTGRARDKRRLERELQARLSQSVAQLSGDGRLTPDGWQGDLLSYSYKFKHPEIVKL